MENTAWMGKSDEGCVGLEVSSPMTGSLWPHRLVRVYVGMCYHIYLYIFIHIYNR